MINNLDYELGNTMSESVILIDSNFLLLPSYKEYFTIIHGQVQ